MLVYSMAMDAPIRDAAPTSGDHRAVGEGYLAGSRALDSLDRLMISTESFFHPSNHGLWSISVRKTLRCMRRFVLTVSLCS